MNRIIFALFCLLATSGALHHEIWTDEARSWILSRDFSLIKVFKMLPYEGHPSLWNILLKLIQLISADPFSMQLLSLAIGIGGFAILIFKSPFGPVEKLLLSMNYYLFYEYTVISRSYVLELPILFALCALYPARWQNIKLFIFLIGLLPLTHSLASFVALGFVALLLVDLIQQKVPAINIKNRIQIGLLTFAMGVFFVLSYIWPYTSDKMPWFTSWSLDRLLVTLGSYGYSWFLASNISISFWTDYFFFSKTAWVIYSSLMITLLIILGWRLKEHSSLISFAIISVGGVIAFRYLLYAPMTRHMGHAMLAIIATSWLAQHHTPRSVFANRAWSFLFAIILCLQAYAGLVALFIDYKHPFSEGKNVAQYLKSLSPEEYELVSDTPMFSASYVAYLPRTFWDSVTNRQTTYSKPSVLDMSHTLMPALNAEPSRFISKEIFSEQLNQVRQKTKKKILLVTYSQLHPVLLERYRLKSLYEFSQAISPFDNFYVYEGL